MTERIAHISDLHFGRDRPELVGPLVDVLNESGAELTIISGDLTQRARHSQFRAAREFIDRLKMPVLCVPGNHDVPLDNVFVRAVRPWSRFARHVSADLEPVHEGAGYVAVGLNTADPRSWQRGRLRGRSLRRVADRLRQAEQAGKLAVVVMHHPPEHDPGDAKRPMRGASKGLGALSRLGADLVLCGHLHIWRAMPFRAAAGLLLVQAGTGLSTRARGEPNDLNLLDIDDHEIRVTRLAAETARAGFATHSRSVFRKVQGRWDVISRGDENF